jgi:DNA (cytosine-5)-methyltransferase 1
MKYLSVCSGIEAASKAWEPIGWEPVAFSEIEPFPSAVLKHHWPKVPNLGDMSKYEQWNIQSGSVDLLVGGTPCQSFSVAGLRQGLKDPRGNLMLTYLAIAERLKPRWLVWENVPGVLSSNGGKDFGSFLGALGELGYEWAYRVLDAQWFGVAQRRRRVFVVAHLGEGNIAAKVLFESESVRRDTPPSREAGKGVATNVAPSLTASNDPSRSPQSSEVTQQVNAVLEATTYRMQAFGEYANDGTALAMKARDYKDATDLVAEPVAYNITFCDANGTRSDRPDGGLYVNKTDVTGSLTRAGIGTNVVQPMAIAFQTSELRLTGKLTEKSVCPTLKANTKAGDTEVKVVLYENHPNDSRVTGPHDVAPSCVSRYGTGGGNVPLVQESMAFQQNTRDEVRYINGDGAIAGALAAETGSKQQNYIHIQQLNEAIPFDTTQITSKANYSKPKAGDPCHPIAAGAHPPAIAFEPGIATREGNESRFVKELSPTLRKEMGDNQVAVAFPIDTQNMTEGHASGGKGHGNDGDPSFTLTKGHSHAVAVDIYNQAVGVKSQTLRSGASSIEHSGGVINPADRMAVRRLTPRECERLQGFPDDHTLIPWRNKPADQCPDGPRYKALGNSMAVPCMAWIGKRIDAVEKTK